MMIDTVFFVIFPYIALAIAIVVTIYRSVYRPFSVSSLSSQLLERKKLYWGSVPFHYGIVLVLLGHLLALLLPSGLRLWNAVPVRLYLLEVTALALGLWAVVGLAILLWRRLSEGRIRAVTTPMDLVVLALVLLSAVTGVLIATVYRFGSFWFTAVFTPYLWSILTLQPDVSLVTPLPWVIKLHVINFFVLLAVFPFSRLVHIITYPAGYLLRPWQLVIWNRRARGLAAGGRTAPGAAGHGRTPEYGGAGEALSVQGRPRDGLLGATLGFFVGFAAVALFGPTANKVNEILHLAPVAVGFLVAMPSLSGSLLRIPFAAWVDTTGGRRPFLVLLGISVFGMAALTLLMWLLYPQGFTPAVLPLLFLLGLLCGSGIAIFSVGTAQVSYWFPRGQQGSALGTYAGIGNLAPGIFSFLLPIALTGLGMAGSYLAWLLFLVVGVVLYLRLGRNAPYFQLRAQGHTVERARRLAAGQGQEIFPSGRLTDSLRLSARTLRTWFLVVIYFTSFGGFLALTAWLPVYWTSFFGVSIVTAGGLTALYSILASLVRVGGGRLADRIGGERTLLIALTVMAIGALLMMLSSQVWLSIVAEIIMALGMGTTNAAVFKLVPQAVPDAVGGASGWVGGLGAFGGFTIPPILGGIVAAGGVAGYPVGFGVFIGLALLSVVMALLFRRGPASVREPGAMA